MSPSSQDFETQDVRVNRALQEYLERLDRGEAVDREQFLAGHPEIADQLRSFIAHADELARRAESPDPAEVSTNQSVSETIAPASAGAGPVLSEVFGRYRMKKLLGRGAMGAVYLAEDTQLARQVAIKVPNFSDDRSEELLKRFYFEARAAAMLRNSHICPIYDVGEIDGQHYISMAYIEGCSLSEIIRSKGPQPERQVLLLIRKLALALQEAHDRGVIHRDLKPGNVMIDRRGEPVVMDFGLACQTREGVERITVSGVILGSPAYMPPEQLEGNAAKMTPLADQYALGVILYELLTGQLPFRGSISAVISQIITTPAPSPRILRTELDPRIEKMCLKMLSKSPADRFESMKAVADHITAMLKESSQGTVPLPRGNTPDRTGENGAAPTQNSKADVTASTAPVAPTEIQKRIETLCLVAGKLIRKHDYTQAKEVLTSVPASQRTDELNELLSDAEDKEEESKALLRDIELTIRRSQPKELAPLVKRYLQLKPGNKAVQQLAQDLQTYGAEKVIRIRQSRQNFLDPAGRIWNPVHIAAYFMGLAIVCSSVYLAAIAFQTPNGTVLIEVHDPRITVNFANDEITAESSGKKFRLKTTEKKTLQLEIDGVVVDSSTQQISVSKNETKLITARLVDGKLNLAIDSQTKTFPVPERSTVAGTPRKGTVDSTNKDEGWIDLLADVDPVKANGTYARWKRDGGRLIGTVVPAQITAWSVLVPPLEIKGDYDLEVDCLVADTNYVQVGLPLNDTIVAASFYEKGTGLHWIDGKDIDIKTIAPPHGNANLRLRTGILHNITASVRHNGDYVIVDTKLDGVDAGRFSGPRSRLSHPKETAAPNHLKIVSPFEKHTENHRLEIHKARVRFANLKALPTEKIEVPATIPTTSTAAIAVAPANSARSENVLLDVDFTKTDGGFFQGDEHHILSEHKNGEFRYLGKLTGWWFNSLHHEFWRKENNQLEEFVVEVDVRIVSTKKGLFAIEFGRSGDPTLSLCLNEKGQVLMIHGGDEYLPPQSSPAMKPVDQFNTLRMVIEKKTARVSVNGVFLFEKKFDRYAGGAVSLWLGPEEVPFDTRIRRVRLERISKKPDWTVPVRRFKGHTDIVRAIAYLPDGQMAVSVGHDKAFKLWDVNTGDVLHSFEDHPDCVASLAVSSDGRRALTGCWDGQVRLWDLENRTLLKTLKGHTGRVYSVLISKDGNTGLSVSSDGVIRQWDLKASKSKILPGAAPDGFLAMNTAENLIASASGDGTITLRNRQGLFPWPAHEPGFIEALAFTADSSKLISGADDGTLKVWDLQAQKEAHRFKTDGVGFDTVALSNNGRYVFAGSADHTIMGWDLQTGDQILKIHADMPVTHRFALSPDNQYILSGGGDKAWQPWNDYDLRLWKLPSPPAPKE